MLPNLLKRSVTGLLFVATVAGAILYSYTSYLTLFALVVLLSLHEFFTLFNRQEGVRVNSYLHSSVGAIFFLILSLHADKAINFKLPVALLLLYFLFVMIRGLYNTKSNPLRNWGTILLGHAYITLPFTILSYIAFIAEGGAYQPWLLLSLFFFVWSSDSGAYAVGSQLGKRRLFERISPKKSWEGFIGGVVFALLASQIVAYYLPLFTPWVWAAISLVVALIGTVGDLCESLIKRTVDVKDSGNILPGHGGMLDRFDAIILAIPAVYAFLLLWLD